MKYLIDQSGKIEQTNKNTIICISNGNFDTLQISAKTKRQLQEIFRRNGQIRNYVLFTFSAGICLILERNPKIKVVTIDIEYFGKEPVIKEIISEMIKDQKLDIIIEFSNIGRRVGAHLKGYLAYIGKSKPKHTVQLEEVYCKIKKTEVGKRLKNA